MIETNKVIYYVDLCEFVSGLEIRTYYLNEIGDTKKRIIGGNILCEIRIVRHYGTPQILTYVDTGKAVELADGTYNKILISNDYKKLAKATLKHIGKVHAKELKALNRSYDIKCDEFIKESL